MKLKKLKKRNTPISWITLLDIGVKNTKENRLKFLKGDWLELLATAPDEKKGK